MSGTVLVTGGAGYIGSHTVVALAQSGYNPVIIDNFCNSRRDVPARIARIIGREVETYDISVLDAVALDGLFAKRRFDAVIHFAALKAVGESVTNPLDYFHTNIAGLTTLLTAMRQADVFHLVFSSSATVYGDPAVIPIPEDAPLAASSPYGITKLHSEVILEEVSRADPRIAVGILRYFNPGGAHESALIGEDPAGIPNNLLPYIQRVAMGDLAELSVFGDDYETADGTGVRDYIHVEDLAEGHVASLAALKRDGKGHVVNLGTGKGASVLELVASYERAVGRALNHRIAPRRPGDVPMLIADPSLAAEYLGFRARRSLDDICGSSWAWVQAGLSVPSSDRASRHRSSPSS